MKPAVRGHDRYRQVVSQVLLPLQRHQDISVDALVGQKPALVQPRAFVHCLDIVGFGDYLIAVLDSESHACQLTVDGVCMQLGALMSK